jgi:hypothetical protein
LTLKADAPLTHNPDSQSQSQTQTLNQTFFSQKTSLYLFSICSKLGNLSNAKVFVLNALELSQTDGQL